MLEHWQEAALAEYPHRRQAVESGQYDCPVCCDSGRTTSRAEATPDSKRAPLTEGRPAPVYECNVCWQHRMVRSFMRWADSAECPAWLHEYAQATEHNNWDGFSAEEQAGAKALLADMALARLLMREDARYEAERKMGGYNGYEGEPKHPIWYRVMVQTLRR